MKINPLVLTIHIHAYIYVCICVYAWGACVHTYKHTYSTAMGTLYSSYIYDDLFAQL